ncbi:unnamed protein product [Larinioides sclopetarius]|uniref:C2H2-type domain-containing protein n=1 Tax=Larinioides sclopetarius TaxID=280406 RepID=A0AAV1ZZD3_9ARAC
MTKLRGRPKRSDIAILIMQGMNSESPTQCKICKRTFNRMKNLNTHFTTHSDEKKYKCDFPDCTKCFKQSSQLKNHLLLHSKEKPFICPAKGCLVRYTHSSRICPSHSELKLIKQLESTDEIRGRFYRNMENLSEADKIWFEEYLSKRGRKLPHASAKKRNIDYVENLQEIHEESIMKGSDYEHSIMNVCDSEHIMSMSGSEHIMSVSDSEHNFTNTSDSEHNFTNTSDSEHNFTNTSDSEHNFTNASGSEHNFTNASGSEHNFTNASGSEHNFTNASGSEHNFTNASGSEHNFTNASGSEHNFTNASGSEHNFTNASGSEHNFTNASGSEHNFTNASGSEHNFKTTSGSEHSSHNTSDIEVFHEIGIVKMGNSEEEIHHDKNMPQEYQDGLLFYTFLELLHKKGGNSKALFEKSCHTVITSKPSASSV